MARASSGHAPTFSTHDSLSSSSLSASNTLSHLISNGRERDGNEFVRIRELPESAIERMMPARCLGTLVPLRHFSLPRVGLPPVRLTPA